AIVYYEYSITVSSEVERFWLRGRQSCASGLFYLNRYLTLFGHIPIVIDCQHLHSYHQYLTTFIQSVVVITLVMRMYALYERSRRVLVLYLMTCALMIGIGLHCVGAFTLHPFSSLTRFSGLAVTWGSLLMFDTLIFSMTLKKSLTAVRAPEVNILTVLFRDGE
ncbi:hypothetical protein BDN70DRAFT_807039, partial [Pholiota conissans]